MRISLSKGLSESTLRPLCADLKLLFRLAAWTVSIDLKPNCTHKKTAKLAKKAGNMPFGNAFPIWFVQHALYPSCIVYSIVYNLQCVFSIHSVFSIQAV